LRGGDDDRHRFLESAEIRQNLRHGRLCRRFAAHMSANDPNRTFKTRSLSLLFAFGQFLLLGGCGFCRIRSYENLECVRGCIAKCFSGSILNLHQTCTALACVALLILTTNRCFSRGAAARSHCPRIWSRLLTVERYGRKISSELIKQSKESIGLYEVSLDTARAQNPRRMIAFFAHGRHVQSTRTVCSSSSRGLR
jgi:hypothetical protein